MPLSELNCVIVLDDSIKDKLKSNIYSLVVYKVYIINNIKELNKEILENTNKVVFLGTISYNQLNEIKMIKKILNLEYYFISDDKLLVNLFSEFTKSYYMNYSNIDSSLLRSVLFDDEVSQAKYKPKSDKLTRKSELEEMLSKSNSSAYSKLIEENILCQDLLEDNLRIQREYKDQINKLEIESLEKSKEVSSIADAYQSLMEKVVEQNRVLKDYETYLTADVYTKVPVSKYKNRPLIIYFKEYQPLIHEGSFIKTLFDVIRVQGKMSAKVIRLHDSNDIMRIKSLENKYTVIKDSYLESDLIKSDFILSYGNYTKIFDTLLTNKGGLKVLIVYDCKKFEDLVLDDINMIYLRVCRDKTFMKYLGLNPSSTINNNNPNTILSWDTLPNFHDFETDAKRFEYLASTKVMRYIYKLIGGK